MLKNVMDKHAQDIFMMRGWISEMGTKLEDAELERRITTSLMIVEQMEQDQMAIMHAVVAKRLDARALHPDALRAGLIDLQRQADRHGYTLFANSPLAALQAEASFEATEKGYKVVLHLPLLAKNSGTLHLYQLLQTPIRIDNRLSYSFTDPRGATYIAISKKRDLYKTLTPTEMNACTKIGAFYVCDNVVRRVLEVDEDEGPDPNVSTTAVGHSLHTLRTDSKSGFFL